MSLKNLFSSWNEFKSGKKSKVEILLFERNLEDNIFELYQKLRLKSYCHSQYTSFFITDPKRRHIHKTEIKDRVVHHAIFRVLYPIFDQSFIFDSYSCRVDKGTHKAVDRLESFIRKSSKNYSQLCFVLKCDVRKFFDSVDHRILIELTKQKISDPEVMTLLKRIISSFSVKQCAQLSLFGGKLERERERDPRPMADSGKGIPIGNLTSQLFANIYMNKFDQFVKHKLRVKYYARYTDDFVIVSNDEKYLSKLLLEIQTFLKNELKLDLHPGKISIRKVSQGIDFLGYVVLPHYRRVRTKTKNRIFRKLKQKVQELKKGNIDEESLSQTLSSYLGVFSHADAYRLEEVLKNLFFF